MLFTLILNEIYLTVTPYAQWCCPQDDNSILQQLFKFKNCFHSALEQKQKSLSVLYGMELD